MRWRPALGSVTVVAAMVASLSAVGAAAATAGPAPTSMTLFSNSPGYPTVATGIASESVAPGGSIAFQFSPTVSGTANLISFYAECNSNNAGNGCAGSGGGTMQLYTDSSGLPGGAIGSAAGFTAPVNPQSGQVCDAFSSPATLTAGTKYWAVMAANDASGTNWLFQSDTASSEVYLGAPGNWSQISPAKILSLRIDQGSACGGHLVPNPDPGTTIANMFPKSGHQDVSTIQLSNDGISNLTIESNSIDGPNASDFQLLDADVKNSPTQPNPFPQTTVLAPGTLVLIYVTCTGPAQEGHFTATAHFTTDTGGVPNTALSYPLSCYVDNTPPNIDLSAFPPGSHGWYNGAPTTVDASGDDGPNGSGTVMIDCTDNGSTSPGLNEDDAGGGSFTTNVQGDNAVACTAGDAAGNVTPNATTATFKVDSVPPSINPLVRPAPNAAGWNNSTPVAVSFTCTDATSGVDNANTSLGAGATFNSDTAGSSVPEGICTDEAGNVTSGNSVTVKIDTVPPTVTSQVQPAPNAAGWNHTSPVTVSFNCNDTESGVDSNTTSLGGATISTDTDTTGTSVSAGTCTDVAGNVTHGAPVTVKLDTVAPTITPDVEPAPNAAGWNNTSPVTVSFGCTDAGSGVDSSHTSLGGSVVSSETAGTSVPAGTCTDVAGNISNGAPVNVKIDKTAPTTSIDSGPPAFTNSTNATFDLSGSDALSGVAGWDCTLDSAPVACEAITTLTGITPDGEHTFAAQAVDAAGNVDPVGQTYSWDIDQTNPSVVIDSPSANVTTGPTGEVVFQAGESDYAGSFTLSCSIDGAPAQACTSPYSYSGLPEGAHTIEVVATDQATNNSAQDVTFTVDADPPVVDILSPSDQDHLDGPATVTWTANDPDDATDTLTYTCSIDGATASACTSPMTLGSLGGGAHTFTVVSTDPYGNASDADVLHFTLNKSGQTIDFTTDPPDPAHVGGTYVPAATGGGSGNPVTFGIDASSDAGVCSLSDGTVHFTASGTCLLDADQAGNDSFSAAGEAQQQITVSKVSTALVLSDAIAPTKFGQPTTFTATVTPAAAGTVQFTIDGTALGVPVTVVGGMATSPSYDGDVASHDVAATFTPADPVTYDGADATDLTHVVGQAATSTSLAVHATTVVATVTATAPGAGTPTGSVAFTVNGASVGSAPLSGGVATLTHTISSGMTQHVAAAYSGDGDFTASSASTARHDPSITAKVTSAHAETHSGWYRSPVTVTFHCVTNGSPLSHACPSPVHFSHNGGSQSVSRTITADNGGVATVSVSPISIDRTPPTVKVTGIKNGATYNGSPPAARCVATDALSGVASCTLTKHASGTVTTYHVKATDRAGNTATVTGSYQTVGISFQGVPFSHGAFTVKAGHTFSLVVPATSRPTYYDAAPFPVTPFQVDPHAFVAAGGGRWALNVTMTNLSSHKYWNVGVKIGSTMHVIKIRVTH